MTQFLLVVALLEPAVFELGAGIGGGVVQDAATVSVTPWAGARTGELALAIQGPLRIDIDAGELRERDWDEPADVGRVLRFVEYGDVVRAGRLVDLDLGNGTLVRRYHNGVDDDHHRLGVRAQHDGGAWAGHVFVDQVAGPPVFGLRGAWRFARGAEAGASFAADSAAPTTLSGDVDAAAHLEGESAFLPAYGVDLGWAFYESAAVELAMHADLNRVDASHPGVHLGLRARLRPERSWRLELMGESMYLGEAYDWAYFDTGYLVDRQRLKAPGVAAYDAAWGGRGRVVFTYAEALVVGVEYADAAAPGRADLSAWLQLPDRELQLSAFWRQRYGAERLDVFAPNESLAAVAAAVPLHPNVSVGLTIAHVWRVDRDAARLRGYTEAGLVVDVGWGL